MTAELLTIAIALLAGAPLALALDPGSRGARLAGESYLLGAGLAAVALLLLSYAGFPWSIASLIALVAPVSFAALLWWLRVRPDTTQVPRLSPAPGPALVIDAVALLLVAGFVLYATAARVGEWDFWAIWGMKAKVFHAARGIDWGFLTDRWHVYTHPDYPPLVPLVYDACSLLRGGWSDRWMGLLTAAWGVAALLLVRAHVREVTGDGRAAALATIAASGFALGPWIGLADIPLLACSFGGCMLLRRWLATGDAGPRRTGAILLGLGALTKNEGVALLVPVALALIAAPGTGRLRRLTALWPAVLLASLWQLPKLAFGLRNDLAENAAARFSVERIVDAADAIARHPSKHALLSIAVALAIGSGLRSLAKNERFVSTIVLAQFSLVFVSYVVTTWPSLELHLQTSWDRVVAQTMPLVIFLSVAALMPRLRAPEPVRPPGSDSMVVAGEK